MEYKILVVDDEGANLRLLELLFRQQFKVITAASGAEALELLRQHDVSLIISDQRMPGMTGIEFLKKAALIRQHTVRIILTGYTDVTALVDAINSGIVYKYVTKPWINEDLQQTVSRAIQHYETIRNQYQLKLQNERLQTLLKRTRENFVKMVIEILQLKDPALAGHLHRTKDYAIAIGKSINLERRELEHLSIAAFLHEAAHIAVPNRLLHKATPLTAEEVRIVKQQFLKGIQIIDELLYPEEVAAAIRCQHEMFDGNGFPEGLEGERIPLPARIIAVADAFDKMTEPHSLQPGCTTNEAIARLKSAAGINFDPMVVDVLCELKSTGQATCA